MRMLRFVRTFHLQMGLIASLVFGISLMSACSFSKQNQTNNILLPQVQPTAPAPVASGTPAPGVPTGSCYVPKLNLGPFGFDCQDGVTKPLNTAGILPMGCVGVFTATPKFLDNTDVPPEIHGSEISWTSSPNVALSSYVNGDGTPENFNRLVTPLKVGEYTVTATVCGVTTTYKGTVK